MNHDDSPWNSSSSLVPFRQETKWRTLGCFRWAPLWTWIVPDGRVGLSPNWDQLNSLSHCAVFQHFRGFSRSLCYLLNAAIQDIRQTLGNGLCWEPVAASSSSWPHRNWSKEPLLFKFFKELLLYNLFTIHTYRHTTLAFFTATEHRTINNNSLGKSKRSLNIVRALWPTLTSTCFVCETVKVNNNSLSKFKTMIHHQHQLQPCSI